MNDDDAIALEHALDVLDASREGVLSIGGEQRIPLRYVVAGADGRLVASVPVAALLAHELILHVPEETDDALQLLLSVEEIAESADTDRWQAHHGQPEHVRWGAMFIDSAKHGPWVFDGDAMMRPNPLTAAEPALCKLANADKAALVRACQRYAGLVVPDPVCVGADPRGLHIRARFGVVRLRFPGEAPTPGAAEAILRQVLSAE